MVATVLGLEGALKGNQFTAGSEPITFGRGDENDVIVGSLLASRVHAELRPEAGGNHGSTACRSTRRCGPTWSGFRRRCCTRCW